MEMDMPADNDATQQIVAHLMGIPFFDRLSETEVEKIYSIWKVTKYDADQMIYQFGTPSDSMFTLLDGQLVARTKTGMDIAYISPIGLVGEMGVITDEPRSADVIGITEAMGLEITKVGLVKLFIEDAASAA
jgi:CRP-like cAMP-binding protein